MTWAALRKGIGGALFSFGSATILTCVVVALVISAATWVLPVVLHVWWSFR